MKKIICFAALSLSLAGCSGFDHKACYDAVARDAGTQDVFELSPYRFVARDAQGKIWYYETMNLADGNVTKKQPVFLSAAN